MADAEENDDEEANVPVVAGSGRVAAQVGGTSENSHLPYIIAHACVDTGERLAPGARREPGARTWAVLTRRPVPPVCVFVPHLLCAHLFDSFLPTYSLVLALLDLCLPTYSLVFAHLLDLCPQNKSYKESGKTGFQEKAVVVKEEVGFGQLLLGFSCFRFLSVTFGIRSLSTRVPAACSMRPHYAPNRTPGSIPS
jgi:hypothetical protein